jgi:hypothetical protein
MVHHRRRCICQSEFRVEFLSVNGDCLSLIDVDGEFGRLEHESEDVQDSQTQEERAADVVGHWTLNEFFLLELGCGKIA